MADAGESPWPLHLLSLLVSLLSSLHSPASTPRSEAAALLLFKSSLAPPPADSALRRWLPGSAPCAGPAPRWPGVACGADGSVTELRLDGMNLSGPLPGLGPLAALPALRAVSASGNAFAGPVPAGIRELGGLAELDLSYNRLSGEVPGGAFDGMPALARVDLSHNELSGGMPPSLARLPRLAELAAEFNRFDGEAPDLRQPGLRSVNLAYNSLQGPIPPGLARFNASVFEGNKNLCGPPLSIRCSSDSPPSLSKNTSPILLFAIIVIFLGVLLTIIGLIMIILAHRHRKNKRTERVFWYTGETTNGDESSDADDKAELGAIGHHHGGANKRNHKEERGKLVFVRERKQRFEIEDLLRASAEILGSGNFGSSYKANLFDGPAVVVKRFKGMNGMGREEFQEYMRRIGRLSHPNLVPLVAYLAKKDEKLLVTEYVPNGSLAHVLHGNRGSNLRPLDWPTRLKVIKGVAKGLLYLYEELPTLTVPHGHLKSSNVLLNESYEPVLSDYGLVPVMSYSHASQVMVAYKSPEFAKYGKLSKKSDVWSFGILILEVLTGNFPTIYLKKGNGGADSANWVSSIVREECTDNVIDAEMMKESQDGRGEMVKLLNIGFGCCEEDVHKRLDLKEVIKRIEDVREREDDGEYSSFVRRNSSKSTTEDY